MLLLKRKTTVKPGGTMQLYERNYTRLLLVFPELATFTRAHEAILDSDISVGINLLNSGPYTSVVSVHCRLNVSQGLVTDPYFKVRVYHDAKVAEVIGYQDQGYFKPWYGYPNRLMYHRNEKVQTNYFLAEMIDFLIKNRAQFQLLVEE